MAVFCLSALMLYFYSSNLAFLPSTPYLNMKYEDISISVYIPKPNPPTYPKLNLTYQMQQTLNHPCTPSSPPAYEPESNDSDPPSED